MRVHTWFLSAVALGAITAAGCSSVGPGACGEPAYNLPPAQQMMHPGPGVGGPGPGVIPPGGQMTAGAGAAGMVPQIGPGGSSACNGGVCQVQYCAPGGGGAGMGATSQIAFIGQEGLQISWDVSGGGGFNSAPLVAPGRQDFPQGAIYRLKLYNIPGREEVTLYPTLEVAPVTPRTDAFLAHSPIPVQFTEEDFDQVTSGNFVTKVVYLPDPEFQELALAGVETLVSTRLDPGCDPIQEADRRGSILAIIRIGNKDLESGGRMMGGQVVPAQYEGEEYVVPPGSFVPPSEGEMIDSGQMYQGPVYEGSAPEGHAYEGAGGPAPVGAPTAGFAPPATPPHMVQTMGGQWGMPMSGTPIGLPGPPHIPLGAPAGLQKHVMTNRTRVVMPPPTPKMHVSVKQRPGLNYPAPVNHVSIDEAPRAPVDPCHGTVQGPIQSLMNHLRAKHSNNCQCEQCCP